MAGRPIRRMMVAELERRAAEAGPGEDGTPLTAIDVVCDYIAEGADEDGKLRTLSELARDLTETIGQTISPGTLSSWINSSKENKAKMTAARAVAAHVLAEQTVTVVDELDGTEVTREEVALAKERASTRQWLASKWNRGTYGGDAQVQINNTQINAADQHLAALVRRAELARAKTMPLLPPADDADYVIEHEIIPAVSEGDDKA